MSVPIQAVHQPQKQGFLLSFNQAYSKYSLKIIQIFKRLLDLDADPLTVEKSLLNAGLLKDEVILGLRIPGVASEFEAACRAVLGQQVSVAAAVNKLNAFFTHFAMQRGDTLPTRFPSPQEVVQSDLSFITIPGARKQTLIDIAAFFAEHYIGETEKNLHQRTDLLQNMLNIKGVGPWTLSYVQMRGSGYSDIWLDTDLVIKKQIEKLKIQHRELNANKAAPFRSYLTLNLWRMSE